MRVLTILAALAFVVPAAAQVVPPPLPARIVEGFLPHRATYDLALKDTRWSSNISGLSGRLVSEFDDVCAGFTFNQRMVTHFTDAEGKSASGNFWVSSYESADGAKFQFSTNSVFAGETAERAQGTAARGSDGKIQVTFVTPNGKTVALPAGIVFPSEFAGRVVTAAKAGKQAASVKLFEGDAEGKVYDAFAAIGPERAASAADLAIPGGETLKGLKGWPVTISYYVQDQTQDLPEYETSFMLFENGVTSAVTLDYGDFKLAGTLVKIEALKAPRC